MRSPALNLASIGLSSNLRALCRTLASIPSVDTLHKVLPAGAGLPQKKHVSMEILATMTGKLRWRICCIFCGHLSLHVVVEFYYIEVYMHHAT